MLTQNVLAYLNSEVDPLIARVEQLSGGETSQAFSFESKGRQFVVRLNGDSEALAKDAYAAGHFASPVLPIPEVTHLGRFSEDLYACVSAKAEGGALAARPEDTSNLNLMPQVMAALDAIHGTPPLQAGYGWFDGEGKAPHGSWPEEVLSIEHADWIDWEAAYTNGLEREVTDFLLQKLRLVAPHMPDEHKLVHGDFGMDNVLVDEHVITAVIDWAAARYGDPLYDVAWLHVWWKAAPFAEAYKNHCRDLGKQLVDYHERLDCYASSIGLSALAFFAQTDQRTKYERLKTRLKEIQAL